MTKIWQKLALATAGAILSFGALKANPAQAARFTFSFDDSLGRNLGSGLISLDEEKLGLTGVGQEEISLPTLNYLYFNSGDLSFSYNNPFVGSLSISRWNQSQIPSPIVLNFDSGNLLGIKFSLPPNQGSFTHPRGIYTIFETAQLFVEGANFREELFQKSFSRPSNPLCQSPSAPPECNQPIITENTQRISGKINFSTIVPFKTSKSVPEPGSAIALSLVGLSLLLNRSRHQKYRQLRNSE